MTKSSQRPAADAPPPLAEIGPSSGASWLRPVTRIWWLTAACLVVATLLVLYSETGRGPHLRVLFEQGHGLRAGDALKYRGVPVGEVSETVLSHDLQSVEVHLRLAPAAAGLARRGSQFWIARPEIGMAGVRGLDTVIGAKYVAVRPGPADGPEQEEFIGLEQAPLGETSPGALEVMLSAPERRGLAAGAPVLYRGIPVGRILSVGLTSDAVHVEARVTIEPKFRPLIRENTRFWTVGGMDLRLGLLGLQLDVESLTTLATGGVAVSVPDPPGDVVAMGHRFALAAEADEDWREWQPSIPLGESLLHDKAAPLPRPIRVVLHQAVSWLGWTRSEQQPSWALPMPGNRLLGLASSVRLAGAEDDADAQLALAGHEFALSDLDIQVSGRLAVTHISPFPEAWPATAARLRAATEPEDCLLIADPLAAPLAISAAHLAAVDDSGWQVHHALPVGEGWQGAAVVARNDGCVIGFLSAQEGAATIIPLDQATISRCE